MAKRNSLEISPLTIAAAQYPVFKRRAKHLGAKSKEYRKPNGAKGAPPAMFLLNGAGQPVKNELRHVYITEALQNSLSDIADKFHAKGMICGSPSKVLSVVVNSAEFETLLNKMCNKMLAHIESGAARFELDNPNTPAAEAKKEG